MNKNTNFLTAKQAKEETLKNSGGLKTIKYIYDEYIIPAIIKGNFYCKYHCWSSPENHILNYFIDKGFNLSFDDLTNTLTISWE